MHSTFSNVLIICHMVDDNSNILILGGIKEAAELATMLVERGHHVTTSLAGRTKEPKPITGNMRIGGFGGVAGLAAYLKEHSIDYLIDATHPFALQISANACAASHQSGVPLICYKRPLWRAIEGDHWQHVTTIEQARDTIPSGATVLLALGRQYIAPFASHGDARFIVRMVDPPDTPLPFKNHKIILGLPKQTAEEEAALFKAHGITHILCRNSGGKGAYAKIEAARLLGLPVIMIDRS